MIPPMEMEPTWGQNPLSSLPNATVHWENNHATLGGAIYVLDASHMSYCNSKSLVNIATLVPKEDCYFQLHQVRPANGL